MKAILVFVATFVIALAGASGAKYVMTKPPVAKAPDSGAVAPDSAKPASDSSPTDTAAAAASAPVAPPGDTLPVAAAKPASAKDSAAAPGAAAPPALTPQQDSAAKEPERRLAKVFTSMDATQAAKVLEHMSDGDVQVILGYVGTRQAAAIMAALPPERVAAISKQTIQGAKR
ncbi:MAG TPA: hypothetical protein VHB25_21080 [Gemmatimonadaceae bacterium]|nr:hypothetical protein [Gemmatimonadaceae bacterium]